MSDDCLVCEGQKWVLKPDGVATRCEGCNTRDVLKLAGVPPSERRWTIGNLEGYLAKLAQKVVSNARNRPTVSSLVVGANGRGKTCLAVAALQELVEGGLAANYVYVPDWLGRLRDAFRRGTTESTLLDELQRPDVLLLDDLGQEHTTPWVQSLVTRLVRHRQVNEQATIITTNLPLRETLGIPGLLETYGSTLVSRLRDFDRLVVPAEAPDLRGR